MMLKDQQSDGTTQLVNLSPYGEWRAALMRLSGRDPVFFAQLQSETNNLPTLTTCIETTCLHCHGVMGQRQLAIDTAGQDDQGCKALCAIAPLPEVPFGKPFGRDEVLVRDAAGNLLWAAGRANTLGAIVDGITDQVLLSKQPVQFPDAPFQPHWQTIERGDQVQVSLYSQSIPPFYLQQRCQDAQRGPGHKNDIQRRYYLTSHLDVNAVTDA